MKCVKLTGLKKLEIVDVPEPSPGPGEVLVRIKACGICGSDVHYYNNGRIGADACVYPQGLGHESSGVVAKAGQGAQFSPGERVAVEPAKYCYSCEHCRVGRYNICPNVKFLASPGMPGAFAEYIVVDQRQLSRLPDSVSFNEGALLEPLAVAYHTITLAHLKPGDTVAVFGAGAIGLLSLAMARACGAGETFIADRFGYRVDFAKRVFHADHIIDTTETDPVAYIRKITQGRGVSITIEAAGEPETFDWTFSAARVGGKCMLVGIPEVDAISFNPHTARRRELLVQNVRRSNNETDACIDLLKLGKLKIDELATHHFALDNITNAFETVSQYKNGVIRAIITNDK